MPIAQLTENEMNAQGVVSLPTRPNGDYSSGGEALSASALKERFDRLPRYIAARLNAVIAALNADPADGEGAIAGMILTGLFPGDNDGHTLSDLFTDIRNGDLAGYLSVGGRSLSEGLARKEETFLATPFSGDALTVADRTEYWCGTITELSLSLPASPASTFCCALVFDTPEGNGSASIDYPEGIRWSGDDIVDGEFLLFGERHYPVFLWYDGAWEATVRGVDL
ncbi:MAG: hypothetical protein IK090_02760 [Clostridia bacterium]|nr:hypothetical protein [Clostridia bacterium]